MFWIHNFGIKYIIHRFDIVFYFFFFKSYFFSFTHTHINHVGPFVFLNIYEIAIVFIFYENENYEKVFSFFVFKSNFLDTKNEDRIQVLKPNKFFCGGSHWKLKMKTKNTIFQLTKQPLNIKLEIGIYQASEIKSWNWMPLHLIISMHLQMNSTGTYNDQHRVSDWCTWSVQCLVIGPSPVPSFELFMKSTQIDSLSFFNSVILYAFCCGNSYNLKYW